MYYFAFGKGVDLGKAREEAGADVGPGHVMGELAQRVGARVLFPENESVARGDGARAMVCSTPQQWGLARRAAAMAGGEDVVYCTGEDIGIPVAVACAALGRGTKVAMFAHNLDRLRMRAALGVFRCAAGIAIWVTNSRYQREFLRRQLLVPEGLIHYVAEQTDTRFFRIGEGKAAKRRPRVVSVGLERRDYRTLAKATEDLDVEVLISGYSKDARVMGRAFPRKMPENMGCRFYSWRELRELYWSADVVAVSLFENRFCAGLTTFLEASACGRPTVITRTAGLVEYLEGGVALEVGPGDARGLREGILAVIGKEQLGRELAAKAYERVRTRHRSEGWLETMTGILEGVGKGGRVMSGST